MKKRSILFFAGFFIISYLLPTSGQGQLVVYDLRCENLKNPLGIDVVKPRLSWGLQSDKRGSRQSAYEILVGSDSAQLAQGNGDVWSSRKSAGTNHRGITYAGKELKSGIKYYWKVRVWDEKNVAGAWSAVQHWSMGLLNQEDWKASWIGLPSIDSITGQDKYVIPPSPLLRKEFNVSGKIARATLYATALGVYEMYLNGEKVGNRYLAPEWTDYAKRVQYQTYDVTHMVQHAQNVIGATLADGWYAGDLWSHFYRGRYGYDRRLFAQLVLEFADGSRSIIATDKSWKILPGGPIREASIFDGEIYDDRFNPEGWHKPGFDVSCWENAFADNEVSVHLNAQMNEPIEVVKQLAPAKIFQLRTAKYEPVKFIVDMGQNMAGWLRLNLNDNAGKTITLRYGEMLNPDSTLYTENLRNAKARDIYIPAKTSTIQFEPKFTYHGFRYVEITGLVQMPETAQVTGMVVASASPVVSHLETSDKDVSRLWENILWTQLGNMHSVPTDCPQRDERSGWMGDAQVFSQTAIFNMDMQAFYKKWFQDIRDEQVDGRLPNYAPYITENLRYYDAPGWVDAAVIIPWKAYVNYGDRKFLEDNFDAMQEFIDVTYASNPDLIRVKEVGQNYGDWLNGNTIKSADFPATGGAIPKEVFNTAYFAYSTALLAKSCKVLGKPKEFARYDSLAKAIKNAFVKNFVDDNGVVKGNTQAGYAMALEFDLIPERLKAKSVQLMLDAIKSYDYRISTGIHTTHRLMNQLSVQGHAEVAYRLLESHRFPSWMYSIDQGATTIWERWDGYVKGRGFQDFDMNSFNHYALGSVGQWFYENILGIRSDENAPGFQHFTISPVPGGSLSWARGTYQSVAGNIGVSWKKENGGYSFEIEIPVNSTATVTLPVKRDVKENGIPVKQVREIKVLSQKNGSISMILPSGKYTFDS